MNLKPFSENQALNLHQQIKSQHTYIQPFNGPFSRTSQMSRYQKGKTNLDLLQQVTMSGSGIS